jgi:hypothetical protein
MASHEHEKDPLLTGQYDVYFEPPTQKNKGATAGDEETAASSSSAQHHYQQHTFVPLTIPSNSLLSGASGSLSSPPRVVYQKSNYSSSHRRAHSTLEGTPQGREQDPDIHSIAGTVSEAATIGSAALHLPDDGPDHRSGGSSGDKEATAGSRAFLYVVYAMVRPNHKFPLVSTEHLYSLDCTRWLPIRST